MEDDMPCPVTGNTHVPIEKEGNTVCKHCGHVFQAEVVKTHGELLAELNKIKSNAVYLSHLDFNHNLIRKLLDIRKGRQPGWLYFVPDEG